jgi:hypothetical protein
MVVAIPDVDKGTIINRYTAHFYDNIPFSSSPKEKMININKFLNTYKNELNNDLILGYYSHLLTDTYFNNLYVIFNYFYSILTFCI